MMQNVSLQFFPLLCDSFQNIETRLSYTEQVISCTTLLSLQTTLVGVSWFFFSVEKKDKITLKPHLKEVSCILFDMIQCLENSKTFYK